MGGRTGPLPAVFTQLYSRVPRAESPGGLHFPMPGGWALTPPRAAADSSRNLPLPLPPLPGIVYLLHGIPSLPAQSDVKSALTDPHGSSTYDSCSGDELNVMYSRGCPARCSPVSSRAEWSSNTRPPFLSSSAHLSWLGCPPFSPGQTGASLALATPGPHRHPEGRCTDASTGI